MTTSERNACVDCRHMHRTGTTQQSYCTQETFCNRWYDRVGGVDRETYRLCHDIRKEQPTDACPHWEAKS